MVHRGNPVFKFYRISESDRTLKSLNTKEAVRDRLIHLQSGDRSH